MVDDSRASQARHLASGIVRTIVHHDDDVDQLAQPEDDAPDLAFSSGDLASPKRPFFRAPRKTTFPPPY